MFPGEDLVFICDTRDGYHYVLKLATLILSTEKSWLFIMSFSKNTHPKVHISPPPPPPLNLPKNPKQYNKDLRYIKNFKLLCMELMWFDTMVSWPLGKKEASVYNQHYKLEVLLK